MADRCNNKMEDTGSTYRCEYPEGHPGPHSNGSWEWWDYEGKEGIMPTLKEQAKNLIVYDFALFTEYHDEDYFDPRNRDMWVRGFCEWLAEKQRKSAEIRASND